MTALVPQPREWVGAVVDLAEALLAEGAVDHARLLLDRARHVEADDVSRYELGAALLRASNAEDGWDLYDLHPSRSEDRLVGVPRWDGGPCATLVVMAEQGLGDAIQFLRYVPPTVRRVGQVVVVMHDELATTVAASRMLAGCQLVDKSSARTISWPTGTRWERMMSLPRHLGPGRAGPEPAYLVPPAVPARLRLGRTDGVTVGVAWRSTPRPGMPDRSLPLPAMLARLATTGTRLISLHRPGDVGAAPATVTQPDIRDLRDTAAVMVQCDLVVSADTVTAHLAPALGLPTIIALRHWPDWRWGTLAQPTRWYATATPLFQRRPGEWADVMAATAARIHDRAWS